MTNGDHGPNGAGRSAESGGTSLVARWTRQHHGWVTMYVDVLSDAFRASDSALTGEALVEYVVACRRHMLTARGVGKPTAYDLLALEIAYDVSLILLCNELGVPAAVADFANPPAERARIERVLAESHGLDFGALARSRHRT